MTKSAIASCAAICALTSILFTSACNQAPPAETAPKSLKAVAAALPANSWVVPPDVNNGKTASQTDWWNFGWQTFVALNWPSATPPASGIVGLPNTQLSIGASSPNQAMVPTAWLTYRGVANTMLPTAQDPGLWPTNPVILPSSCPALTAAYPVSPGFQPMLLDLVTKFESPVKPSNSDEASGPPLVQQSRWYVTYDIRISQSEFTYIQQNGYYNAATQVAAEKSNGQLLPFPQTGQESTFNPPLPALAQFGALEVKAAWRILDPVADKAIIPRYYTQTGYFLQQDGTTCQGPALFGLIGLHILRLTPTVPATWFWATFEQVDNVTPPPGATAATLAAANTPNGSCTAAYNVAPAIPTGNITWSNSNAPVNVCQVTNISQNVANINKTWQGNLAGTVWANYQLVDTINPSVSGGPSFSIPISTATVNTDILANTTMETYLQAKGAGKGQSCMDCHSFATPQGAPSNATNQIFTFALMNAATPASPGAALKRKGPLPPKVAEILRSLRKKK